MIKNLILVAAGGGIGAVIRYWLFFLVKNQPFPYATFVINIVGSFALGLIIAWSLKVENFPEGAKLFLTVGICGGFTTFSTFSLENLLLLQEGKYNLAFVYIVSSVVVGIIAAWFGFKLMNQ